MQNQKNYVYIYIYHSNYDDYVTLKLVTISNKCCFLYHLLKGSLLRGLNV